MYGDIAFKAAGGVGISIVANPLEYLDLFNPFPLPTYFWPKQHDVTRVLSLKSRQSTSSNENAFTSQLLLYDFGKNCHILFSYYLAFDIISASIFHSSLSIFDLLKHLERFAKIWGPKTNSKVSSDSK